jgi:hypothetical protein
VILRGHAALDVRDYTDKGRVLTAARGNSADYRQT